MARHAEAGTHPRRAAYALALAVALALSGRADAACGDHVRGGDEPAPIRPCAGPECSQAPASAPLLPPAPPPPPGFDALALAGPAPQADPSRFVRPIATHLLPLHDDSPPSPPPR